MENKYSIAQFARVKRTKNGRTFYALQFASGNFAVTNTGDSIGHYFQYLPTEYNIIDCIFTAEDVIEQLETDFGYKDWKVDKEEIMYAVTWFDCANFEDIFMNLHTWTSNDISEEKFGNIDNLQDIQSCEYFVDELSEAEELADFLNKREQSGNPSAEYVPTLEGEFKKIQESLTAIEKLITKCK